MQQVGTLGTLRWLTFQVCNAASFVSCRAPLQIE